MSDRRSLRSALAALTLGVALLTTIAPARSAGVDLVYLMDESGSVGSADFAVERNFITDVTLAVRAPVPFGPTGLAAGLVQHASDARLTQPLTFSSPTFHNSLNATVARGGASCPSCAIALGRQELASARGRALAPDVLVLLTDGSTESQDQLPIQAAAARASGIALIGIVVGDFGGVRSAISDIVSSSDDFFAIAEWSDLNRGTLVEDVAERILARVAPVPEPGAYALLGLGLLALGGAGLRRRASRSVVPAV